MAAAGGEKGFSLIELLITMTISTFMVIGVLATFGNVSRTYKTVRSVSLMQENGRFAIAEMTQSLMQAYFYGKLGNPTLQVTNEAADAGEVDCGKSWIWRMGQPIFGYDQSSYTMGTLTCIPTSDTASDIVIARMSDNSATDAAALVSGQDYLYSDLVSGSLFRHGVDAAPAALTLGQYWGVKGVIYYVKNNAAGIPCLYRYDTSKGTEENVVPGVEKLQVSYGVKSGSGTFIENYYPASTPPTWGSVIAVRIEILVRSLEADRTYQENGVCRDLRTYTLGNASYTPTDAQPTCYRRRVFSSTVQLRNIFMRLI